MPEAPRKTPSAFLLRPVLWAVLAGLLALYALLGFYAVPRHADRGCSRTPSGPTTPANSPSARSASIPSASPWRSMPSPCRTPMADRLLAFDRLRVDVELDSLWHRALSFRESRRRRIDRSTPSCGLAARSTSPTCSPHAATRRPQPSPCRASWWPHLRVGKSRVRFTDLDRPEPFVAEHRPRSSSS
jgi:hypothetical protein